MPPATPLTSRSRLSTTSIRSVPTVRPDAPDRHRLAHSLDLPPPRVRPPVVVLFDGLPNFGGREHGTGSRDGRDAAREVHRVPVPVATALERATHRDARAKRRE